MTTHELIKRLLEYPNIDVFVASSNDNGIDISYHEIGDIELWDETIDKFDTHLTIYEGDMVSG